MASSGLTISHTPSNFDAIREAIADATGGAKTLLQITQDDEVDLTIRGAIPRADWGDAILIDIGTSTVKCGYHHPKRGLHVARNYVVPTVIEGSGAYARTIQKEVEAASQRGFAAFCDAAERLRQKAVVDKIADQKERMAGLENRSKVYLSGGVPWAIATITHPEAVLRPNALAVPLPLERVRAFREQFRLNGQIPKPDAPDPSKEAVEAVADVLDRFSKEQLLAGTEVLLGFADVLDWEKSNKEVLFTQSGVVAWIVGFVERERTKRGR